MANIRYKKLHPGVKVPTQQTNGAAGYDIHAWIEHDNSVFIHPGDSHVFQTGLAFELSKWLYVEVLIRSSLAFKHSIILTNGVGIIDSDYRGEVMIKLTNLGVNTYIVNSGDRIAQMMVKRVESIFFEEVNELSETERNHGGFGSTGRQ